MLASKIKKQSKYEEGIYMKTYSNYIITRPWLKYNVKYDYNKIMGLDDNYGNPLDSPIISDLIYSIDILSKRIRKTTDKYSKPRYIDVVFEMEGDLNFYLRSPRQRYLDDLLYLDREPNKWKETENNFMYCISDLESLSKKTAQCYVDIVNELKEDFSFEIGDYNQTFLEELYEKGYILQLDCQNALVNPFLIQRGMKYRYVAEKIWEEKVSKEMEENLEKVRNRRVYGMESVPFIPNQSEDYIRFDLLEQ